MGMHRGTPNKSLKKCQLSEVGRFSVLLAEDAQELRSLLFLEMLRDFFDDGVLVKVFLVHVIGNMPHLIAHHVFL